jgi:hypothetical protein
MSKKRGEARAKAPPVVSPAKMTAPTTDCVSLPAAAFMPCPRRRAAGAGQSWP